MAEMLELSKVDQVVDKAAIAALKKARVSRVFSNPTVDSDGHEALSVTIVLKRGRSEQVTGDSASNVIFQIGRDLLNSGEERQPIVHFITEEELDDDGDPES
jgi:hypothetical protein